MSGISRTAKPARGTQESNGVVDADMELSALFREMARNQLAKSRKTLAAAQAIKQVALEGAIKDAQARARRTESLAEAARKQAAECRSDIHRIEHDTESELARIARIRDLEYEQGRQARENANRIALGILDSARATSESLRGWARSAGAELGGHIRREASGQVRRALTDIEIARAASADEIRAQDILNRSAEAHRAAS